LAFLLFAIAACLRLVFLDADPPGYQHVTSGSFATDEGIWSFLAREWAQGHDAFGHSESLTGSLSLPYTVAQTAMFKLFGVGLVQVRLTCALLGSLLPPLFFLLGRRIFGVVPAFLMALLLATNFLLIMYQRTGMVDGWLVVWVSLAFLEWERALSSEKVYHAVLAGVLTGIALWSKVTALPFLIAAAFSGLWGLIEPQRRPTLVRIGVAFSVGLGSVGLLAFLVFSSWPGLADAARETLAVNPNRLAPDLMGWLWHVRGILYHNPFNFFMPGILLAALGSGVGLGLALLRRRPLRISLCAGLWVLFVAAMLVVHGYTPPRYYLQAIPAIIVLAIQGLAWLWHRAPRQPQLRAVLRSGVVLLVLAEISRSLWGLGSWVVTREYSQRDIGMAIAEELGPDLPTARVSGRWAFDLALSGGFQPMGFYGAGVPWLQQTPSLGGTHFLFQGPLGPELHESLRQQGLAAKHLATYTYLQNYYETKEELSLYQFIPALEREPTKAREGPELAPQELAPQEGNQ
jgi:hypothetical protein